MLVRPGLGRVGGGGQPRASFELEATTGALPAGATFTRASGATRINHRGYLEEVGNNVARYTYDPALEYNHLLNPWFDGAVVGTPGTPPTGMSVRTTIFGVPTRIVGAGVEGGVPYLDIGLTGTTTASGVGVLVDLDLLTGAAQARAGETWNLAIYQRMVAGASLDTRLQLVAQTAAGGDVANTIRNVADPTDGALVDQRVHMTWGLSVATTERLRARVLLNSPAVGVALDCVLRVGFPTLTRAASPITDRIPLAILAERRNGVPQYGLVGLMAEEATTNFQRNPRAEGGVAGSPGTPPSLWGFWSPPPSGLTRTLAYGTLDGIPYVDVTYTGTLASPATINHAFTGSTDASAVAGQTWAVASYVSVFGSSLPTTAFLRLQEVNASVYTASNVPIPRVSTAPDLHNARQEVKRMFTDASTTAASGLVSVALAAGAVNFTLRMALPQVEQGGTATSVVLPPAGSPAASTRAAETPTVPLGPWFRPDQGTLVVEGSFGPARRAVQSVLVNIDDGTTWNTIAVRSNVAHDRLVSEMKVANTTLLQQVHATPIAVNAMRKVAIAWRSGSIGGAAVGVAGTPDVDVFATPTFTTLRIGHSTDAQQMLNGVIRRVTYYPRRLSDARLAQLTK